MKPLRKQVDQIDLKILKLLQQRIKVSVRIGQTKQRHGAPIYVPERERELVARLARENRGRTLPGLAAVFREIMSGSRAAQQQPDIGLLEASAPAILLSARWCFGSASVFAPQKTWEPLAKGLQAGKLSMVLLTGADLVRIFRSTASYRRFFEHFTVTGDFASRHEDRLPLADRVFIVVKRAKGASCEANRLLILMKCKSVGIAVKSLLRAMPDRSLHAEHLALPTGSSMPGGLVRLTLPKPRDGIRATTELLAARQAAGLSFSILGVYLCPDNHAG